jgi:hypothetical protein
MNTRYTKPAGAPRVSFAPGDQVIRYIDGKPFVCTVVEVEEDDHVRVACNMWPSGYSAVVKPQEVALVSRRGMPGEF